MCIIYWLVVLTPSSNAQKQTTTLSPYMLVLLAFNAWVVNQILQCGTSKNKTNHIKTISIKQSYKTVQMFYLWDVWKVYNKATPNCIHAQS